ncbi:hypothetical protein PG990_015241 [Apiospora arundinis]
MNNPSSIVPGDFSSLTTANSIYINGVVDNTTSPALFPLLSNAGEVRIETWNPEFDCSQLVQMHKAGRIGSLFCNGTNGINGSPKNGNTTSIDPNSPSTPSSTSQGGGLPTATAAGIGVGVGVAALGSILVLAWLIIHYRRKLRDVVEKSHNNGRDDPKETVREVPEPQGALIDGNQVHEGDSRSLPHQAGGAEVLEAGGTALRAEAGDEQHVVDDARAALPAQSRPPVELA